MVFYEEVVTMGVRFICGGCCSIKKGEDFIWKCDQEACPMWAYKFAKPVQVLETPCS